MKTPNPYAPTRETAEVQIRHHHVASKVFSKVSSTAVAMRSIAGTGLAGGAFGFAIGLVVLVIPGIEQPWILLYAGFAFAAGLVLASVAACITVPVLMGMFLATRRQAGLEPGVDGSWPPVRINSFGILSGGISGYGSVVVSSGFAAESFIWGLLPAIAGAIGSRWMLRPCVRMALQDQLEAQQRSDPPIR